MCVFCANDKRIQETPVSFVVLLLYAGCFLTTSLCKSAFCYQDQMNSCRVISICTENDLKGKLNADCPLSHCRQNQMLVAVFFFFLVQNENGSN